MATTRRGACATPSTTCDPCGARASACANRMVFTVMLALCHIAPRCHAATLLHFSSPTHAPPPALALPACPRSGAFRRFIGTVERDFKCRHFSEHPLSLTEYDRPVVGAAYAPSIPPTKQQPAEVCSDPSASGAGASGAGAASVGGSTSGGATSSCECGFRRFSGVDNAAYAQAKPAYGYGHAVVPLTTLKKVAIRAGGGGGGGGAVTLEACERACCEEKLCHSVTWLSNTSTCIASLAIAHGARSDDWCWHPTASVHAVTSIRLPGKWEERAIKEAQGYLRSRTLVRRGDAAGPRALHKQFSSPVGHSHPMERTVEPSSCTAPSLSPGAYEVSDIAVSAVPYASQVAACPGASPTTWTPKPKQQKGGGGRWGRRGRRHG